MRQWYVFLVSAVCMSCLACDAAAQCYVPRYRCPPPPCAMRGYSPAYSGPSYRTYYGPSYSAEPYVTQRATRLTDRSGPQRAKRSRFDSGRDPSATSKDSATPKPGGRATSPKRAATVPKEPIDIEPTLAARPNFSLLLGAGLKANAIEKLNNPGPFTIFAPTDEAFRKLPPELLSRLMNDPKALEKLLFHHAITAEVVLADALKRGQEKTALGSTLQFSRQGDEVFVNGVKILEADMMCRNGVVHVVDRVLFPAGMEAELAAPRAAAEPPTPKGPQPAPAGP